MASKIEKNKTLRKPKAISRMTVAKNIDKIDISEDSWNEISTEIGREIDLSTKSKIEELFLKYYNNLLHQTNGQEAINKIKLREKDGSILRKLQKLNQDSYILYHEIASNNEYRHILSELNAYINIACRSCPSLEQAIIYNNIIDTAFTNFFEQKEVRVVSAKEFYPKNPKGTIPDPQDMYTRELAAILRDAGVYVTNSKSFHNRPIINVMQILNKYLPEKIRKAYFSMETSTQGIYRSLGKSPKISTL